MLVGVQHYKNKWGYLPFWQGVEDRFCLYVSFVAKVQDYHDRKNNAQTVVIIGLYATIVITMITQEA